MSNRTDRLLGRLEHKEQEKDKSGATIGAAAAAFTGGNESTNELKSEPSHKGTKEPSIIRKRYSFDLRPAVQKKFKIQAAIEDQDMYEIVEELIIKYLQERGVKIDDIE